ncbi:MAG TPA: 30S ribosomal protein S9 [Candidatus Krumholzibacteria bacterium]|jgi:small subunit ribosomal protein S9|nr:30S ribosomal protein S9 [Candidatus Krumholzibacteria bacterium]
MAKPLYATGRRKEAIARVRLTPGSGNLLVNGRALRDYLHRDSLVRQVMQPFEVAQAATSFDLVARVRGGGSTGQAGALRLGVARALLKHDPELRKPLRKIGLLTRDPRMKERKKYGLRGARRAFQFSKR